MIVGGSPMVRAKKMAGGGRNQGGKRPPLAFCDLDFLSELRFSRIRSGSMIYTDNVLGGQLHIVGSRSSEGSTTKMQC